MDMKYRSAEDLDSRCTTISTRNLRRNVLKVLTSSQISDVSVSVHYGFTEGVEQCAQEAKT
jgi:hypothetical protein